MDAALNPFHLALFPYPSFTDTSKTAFPCSSTWPFPHFIKEVSSENHVERVD